MGYYGKWKPSKAKAKAYAQEMDRINEFCRDNGIHASSSNDSYYFDINGKSYRVSNHSVESSNSGAYHYDWMTGTTEKVRAEYHPGGRDKDTVYIHASKTRIIEIYTDLKNGYQLDGRGYRID